MSWRTGQANWVWVGMLIPFGVAVASRLLFTHQAWQDLLQMISGLGLVAFGLSQKQPASQRWLSIALVIIGILLILSAILFFRRLL